MLIENKSKYLLKKTRAKAKMFEYNVPLEDHILVEDNAIELLLTTIGIIGDVSEEFWVSSEIPLVVSKENKEDLEFSARFFDALFQSKIEISNEKYYKLLGAIAYYFSDRIGSAMVLTADLEIEDIFDSSDIATVILILLSNQVDKAKQVKIDGKYRQELVEILDDYDSFFNSGKKISFDKHEKLRSKVYSAGTSRELLLVDALLAIFKKKIVNSANNLMPIFSDIDSEIWHEQLLVQTRLRELWPAQISFGIEGIFKGESGTIQMPTSSGKTTSIALTIQAAFLANRTKLAVVIAPFRALCAEISNDLGKYFKVDSTVSLTKLSDIPDSEIINESPFEFEMSEKKIIVLTPEKFIYLLRHDKSILENMGLVVFDEAHLFDDNSRGANYELLLSTIKYYLDNSESSVQKLLISAVISNSKEINKWFNGENGIVISDNTIKSAEKTVAFSDWNKSKNTEELYFINPENVFEEEFYVPRVIEKYELEKFGKETKKRFFPEVMNANDLSIYYAIKLNHIGGVAIFCGTKQSVKSILDRVMEIDSRGYNTLSLKNNCIDNENDKIANLIRANFGSGNSYYLSAQKGIFAHHSGIPMGLRNSIEYAIKNNLIKCVVCTSTLAQGVNLPLKYLIIPSMYQAGKKIKVRDFHNLMGRTGRAGKYTEGSVILTEPDIYSKRRKKKWKFNKYAELLNATNSEKCLSNILRIVQNFDIYDSQATISIPLTSFIEVRYEGIDKYTELLHQVKDLLAKSYPKSVNIFDENINILENSLIAIENYILDFWTVSDCDINDVFSQTFGYFMARDEEKIRIKNVFEIIKNYLELNVTAEDIYTYGKSQIGVFKAEELKGWVGENLENLLAAENEIEILSQIISQIVLYSENNTLKKIINQELVPSIALKWINGESYADIFEYSNDNGFFLRKGRDKQRNGTIEDVIDICDNGFGYSSTLIINAIAEIISPFHKDDINVKKRLNNLCQMMRYGLSKKTEIILFELGFTDRVLAQKIGGMIDVRYEKETNIKKGIKKHALEIELFISEYPKYFESILANYLK